MGELVKGRSYPLPSPGRLVALRAVSEGDVGHPVVRSVFEWLRAVVRVQHELGGEGGFRYQGNEVHAGEAVIDLELWEGLLLLPFVPASQWEEGMSFSDRVELRLCFDQIRTNLPFVDAAPLRCQPRLLLAPILEATDTLRAARELGIWFEDHRSARLPVLMPLLAHPASASVEGWR